MIDSLTIRFTVLDGDKVQILCAAHSRCGVAALFGRS
jgi:hypothetical protein